MMRRLVLAALVSCLPGTLSCATTTAAPPPAPAHPKPVLLPEETHLADLRQLTFGGENAEAYWSFDGRALSLQAHAMSESCDHIYTMPVFAPNATTPLETFTPKLFSSGKGATTCSHYLPDGDVLYASTHLGGDACPPKPDMSLGYVWALYDSYDVFKAKPDGTGLTRLTDTKGYDAEATVCGKDGSIIFTSVRDGDIELYRMDKDGKNVKRLTFEPGYDGGAFFNKDCSKIVWRASRPKQGKELDEFKDLLSKGLVRPSKLELYVANADGSDAHQVTYLNAASFAPFWFPNRDRIIFASNVGDPKAREFDLWAINADGTDLERITYTKSFDGFPMFSPDGKWLAFSSNRMTPEGQNDTNVFLARWVDGPVKTTASGAERIKADVTWLADPAREGRGVGTKGLEEAGAFIEKRFQELGLEPVGEHGFRSPFQVTTTVKPGPSTALKVNGTAVAAGDFVPAAFSGELSVKGKAVLAGYGIEDDELGIDDYKGLDVKGKVVVVRRFAPEHEKLDTPEAQRKAGDLHKKAFVAGQHGAKALVIVDWPVLPPPAAAAPGAPAAMPKKGHAKEGKEVHVEGPQAEAEKKAAAEQGAAKAEAAKAPEAKAAAGGNGEKPADATPGAGKPADPKAGAKPGEAKAPDAKVADAKSAPAKDPHAHADGAAPQLPPEAPLPELHPGGTGDAGLPVVIVKRSVLEKLMPKLEGKKSFDVEVTVALEREKSAAFNVVGRIPAGKKSAPGAIILGAHYDHLGYGGPDSLAPDKHEPHLGADDNASGTATLLEIARLLSARKDELTRDVIVTSFSAEESGVLGSAALVASKPAWMDKAVAMLNLDMVGRLRMNTLSVLGAESATEWKDLVQAACEKERVRCNASGDGYGPSDHMSFYSAGLPVLFFFTGAHSDYHKPSDSADKLNDGGMARVALVAADLALAAQGAKLTYQKIAAPPAKGDARSYNASLGTVPDYGGPPPGQTGVLLSDVRPGGGADKAGMKRGDIIVKLGKYEVRSVEDLMFVLMQAKPGETVTATVIREGKPVALEATFQEGRRR